MRDATPTITRIERIEDVDGLLADSASTPVLIYKHSYTCGTSAYALDELTDLLHRQPTAARYAMVAVQTHRDASSAIATRLGVRHETPQVLLVRDGRVVWSASHFRVTADAIEAALTAHAAGAR
jgi:bacillithiol system protein YtxJ